MPHLPPTPNGTPRSAYALLPPTDGESEGRHRYNGQHPPTTPTHNHHSHHHQTSTPYHTPTPAYAHAISHQHHHMYQPSPRSSAFRVASLSLVTLGCLLLVSSHTSSSFISLASTHFPSIIAPPSTIHSTWSRENYRDFYSLPGVLGSLRSAFGKEERPAWIPLDASVALEENRPPAYLEALRPVREDREEDEVTRVTRNWIRGMVRGRTVLFLGEREEKDMLAHLCRHLGSRETGRSLASPDIEMDLESAETVLCRVPSLDLTFLSVPTYGVMLSEDAHYPGENLMDDSDIPESGSMRIESRTEAARSFLARLTGPHKNGRPRSPDLVVLGGSSYDLRYLESIRTADAHRSASAGGFCPSSLRMFVLRSKVVLAHLRTIFPRSTVFLRNSHAIPSTSSWLRLAQLNAAYRQLGKDAGVELADLENVMRGRTAVTEVGGGAVEDDEQGMEVEEHEDGEGPWEPSSYLYAEMVLHRLARAVEEEKALKRRRR